MAERRPDPRASVVDSGWAEAPTHPTASKSDVPGAGLLPPPPPLPWQVPTAPAPPPTPFPPGPTELPRELPVYEDSPRELLVTRVDDQVQARASAMREPSEKTVVAAAAPDAIAAEDVTVEVEVPLLLPIPRAPVVPAPTPVSAPVPAPVPVPVPVPRAPVAPAAVAPPPEAFTPSHLPGVTAVDPYPPAPTLREALLGRVRMGDRALPLWAILAVALFVTTTLAGLVVGAIVGTGTNRASKGAATTADSGEGAATSSDPQPAEGTSRRAPTLLERAANGEASALTALEQKKLHERGSDEALALFQGKAAQEGAGARKLRERLAADPGLAKDPKVVADLLRFAHARETSHDALAAMASIPGPLSADLVYEVWTGTAERSEATELARAIVLGRDVRPKASPALVVALELREASTCEESLAILPRAIEKGDKRALVPINRLARRTGCGPNKRLDCYPCLREGDLLKRAFNAVRLRREPDLLKR